MNMTDVFSLKGKIVWVVGASYGIGFAIASALAESGAAIAFNDINHKRIDKALEDHKKWRLKPLPKPGRRNLPVSRFGEAPDPAVPRPAVKAAGAASRF
ncbi:MAG: SDR family NAD(P)-dependent oxidoreductase [Treponema sp.]|nr:SDR family NAD(P)-dependent oxidoreductase [Treponema sp.]